MASSPTQRVCVIGAGIAGLVTAKVLREDGFDIVVLEKEATIGGVWAASRTYPGLRTNNPRESYAFSDHPYPATADAFPTAEQVRAYLESYVDRLGLRPHIRLGTEVIEVRRAAAQPNATAGFEVTVRPGGTTSPETHRFDFVAVCNGTFSQARTPEIAGREQFAGKILHSSELTDPHVADGKRVIVVGGGKSALDCAVFAASAARSCTLVFRAPHWMAPRYFFDRVRLDYLMLTRFSEAFLRYHRPGRVEALLHGFGKPLVRLWWRGLCAFLSRDVPPALVPDAPLPSGFENVGVGNDLYRLVREEKLAATRGRIARFTETGLALESGERVDADLVIFATGWQQSLPFLAPALRGLIDRNGFFHLYRHILPPQEPRLGFVGYASSIACQLTAEVAAHWLSQCFRGELPLPSVAAMDEEIGRVARWLSEVFPAQAQGFFVGPYLAHYLDDLMRDMNLRTMRTSNVLAEHLGPVWPSRYAGLGEERRRARERTRRRRLYVSGAHILAAAGALAALWLILR